MTSAEAKKLSSVVMRSLSVSDHTAHEALRKLTYRLETLINSERSSHFSMRNKMRWLLLRYHDSDCDVMTTFHTNLCTCEKMGRDMVDEHY
jgi:translation initiation factor 2B subunit (eIF-2B alpha/beta/delta family)